MMASGLIRWELEAYKQLDLLSIACVQIVTGNTKEYIICDLLGDGLKVNALCMDNMKL
jgi:hypothetical protein